MEEVASERDVFASGSQPWRKILYVKQPYPDNYVDGSFLELMQKNVNLQPQSYCIIVLNTVSISMQMTCLLLFVGVFTHLHHSSLPCGLALCVMGVFTLAGYCIWDGVTGPTTRQRKTTAYGALKVIATLAMLTPVLRTLTTSISSDTIYALATFLFMLHLCLHNYSLQAPADRSYSVQFPDALALSFATLASTLLSSRLPTFESSFTLLSASVFLFGLLPIWRRSVLGITIDKDDTISDLRLYRSQLPPKPIIVGRIAVLTLLALVTVGLYWPISITVTITYIAGLAFVGAVCPAWLIYAMRYKSEIRGPWDEARVIQ